MPKFNSWVRKAWRVFWSTLGAVTTVVGLVDFPGTLGRLMDIIRSVVPLDQGAARWGFVIAGMAIVAVANRPKHAVVQPGPGVDSRLRYITDAREMAKRTRTLAAEPNGAFDERLWQHHYVLGPATEEEKKENIERVNKRKVIVFQERLQEISAKFAEYRAKAVVTRDAILDSLVVPPRGRRLGANDYYNATQSTHALEHVADDLDLLATELERKMREDPYT